MNIAIILLGGIFQLLLVRYLSDKILQKVSIPSFLFYTNLNF